MLGFAIVGCGMIARFHARALAEVPGAKLTAVISRSEANARKMLDELKLDIPIFTKLEDALKRAEISQYELAKRLAGLRETHLGSQDQAIRRIRKEGQTPTADVARDLAKAFRPELKLPPNYFVSEGRPRAAATRQAAEEALAEVRLLRNQVAELEKEVRRLSRKVGSQPPPKSS